MLAAYRLANLANTFDIGNQFIRSHDVGLFRWMAAQGNLQENIAIEPRETLGSPLINPVLLMEAGMAINRAYTDADSQMRVIVDFEAKEIYPIGMSRVKIIEENGEVKVHAQRPSFLIKERKGSTRIRKDMKKARNKLEAYSKLKGEFMNENDKSKYYELPSRQVEKAMKNNKASILHYSSVIISDGANLSEKRNAMFMLLLLFFHTTTLLRARKDLLTRIAAHVADNSYPNERQPRYMPHVNWNNTILSMKNSYRVVSCEYSCDLDAFKVYANKKATKTISKVFDFATAVNLAADNRVYWAYDEERMHKLYKQKFEPHLKVGIKQKTKITELKLVTPEEIAAGHPSKLVYDDIQWEAQKST